MRLSFSLSNSLRVRFAVLNDISCRCICHVTVWKPHIARRTQAIKITEICSFASAGLFVTHVICYYYMIEANTNTVKMHSNWFNDFIFWPNSWSIQCECIIHIGRIHTHSNVFFVIICLRSLDSCFFVSLYLPFRVKYRQYWILFISSLFLFEIE